MYNYTLNNATHGSNQMLQAMSAQMGPMNMMSMGGMGGMGGMGSSFFYMGNVIGLESKIQTALSQPTQLTDVSITVTGNQIKQFNVGCLILTTVSASLILIPMFFMCCQWWKKMVYPAHSVPLSTYQKLQALVCSSSIKAVTLTVLDSTFDSQKAKLLYNMLSRSSVKGFTFTNLASPNNCNSDEWTEFKAHMIPIKSLPIMSDMKWYDQVVL